MEPLDCLINRSFKRQCICIFSLLGVDKVIQYAVTEWLTDIRKNQLPGILGGVGPMHSVVQLCKSLLQSLLHTLLSIQLAQLMIYCSHPILTLFLQSTG